MHAQVEKSKMNKSRAAANINVQEKSVMKQVFGIVDNRPGAIAQRKCREMANNSPQMQCISLKGDVIQREVKKNERCDERLDAVNPQIAGHEIASNRQTYIRETNCDHRYNKTVLQRATVMTDDGKLKRIKERSISKAGIDSEKLKQKRLTSLSHEVIKNVIKKGYDPGPEVQCSKVGKTLYVAINTNYPNPRVEDSRNPRHAVSTQKLFEAGNADHILLISTQEALKTLKLSKWIDGINPIASDGGIRNHGDGKQHAESRIINELLKSKQGQQDLAKHASKKHVHKDHGMRVIRIGGTKPPCLHCEDAFEGTGTLLKDGTSYRELIRRKNLSIISIKPEGVEQDKDTTTNWLDAMNKRQKKC